MYTSLRNPHRLTARYYKPIGRLPSSSSSSSSSSSAFGDNLFYKSDSEFMNNNNDDNESVFNSSSANNNVEDKDSHTFEHSEIDWKKLLGIKIKKNTPNKQLVKDLENTFRQNIYIFEGYGYYYLYHPIKEDGQLSNAMSIEYNKVSDRYDLVLTNPDINVIDPEYRHSDRDDLVSNINKLYNMAFYPRIMAEIEAHFTSRRYTDRKVWYILSSKTIKHGKYHFPAFEIGYVDSAKNVHIFIVKYNEADNGYTIDYRINKKYAMFQFVRTHNNVIDEISHKFDEIFLTDQLEKIKAPKIEKLLQPQEEESNYVSFDTLKHSSSKNTSDNTYIMKLLEQYM